MASKVFSVTRQEPELIGPASPTPHEIKHLSDIDANDVLKCQVRMLFFYKNESSMKGIKDPVNVIREALSKALVFYYPLAGRVNELPGSDRKLVVDCNGEGVFFIEADANLKLEDLGDAIQPPFPYLDRLLYNVPGSEHILGGPLLLIQVTRLTCGGFVLALRLNHTMCDAIGLILFLKTMEEMAGGALTPSLLPIWQRELLNSRDPPQITSTRHEFEEKVDNTMIETIFKNTYTHDMKQKSFYFGPNEIKALHAHLPLHLRHDCSTFDLITACIWKCRTTALDLNPDEVVRVLYAVNVREILSLPPGYYGNAILTSDECTKANLLCKNPLGYAVELVKKSKARTNKEYIRSMIDFMVSKGRPNYVFQGNFGISDITRVGFGDVDFGWGKPVYAGPAEVTPFYTFYIKCQIRANGEHGILVPICLSSSTIDKFEKEVDKMIRESVAKEDLYKDKKSTKISLCRL